ncbi:endonuclease domain-containing protein [Microvirga sp. 2MCAF38]|uniref:endonuclease domain-containing protein n=1 Tax=Microvirga sp. 2MCAF38 TaxID=3232989 RepID=UPI003F9720B9
MPWNRPAAKPVSPRAARYAKDLRRTPTEPEQRLWWHLRHRLPVTGTHFRRQVPIGSYITDFCCLGARLIVEVDGNQHGADEAQAYDKRRTNDLEREGFHVLRFSNAEIMRDMDVVLDTIHAALVRTIPDPSSQAGWEPEA